MCLNFGHTDSECFLATQEEDKWVCVTEQELSEVQRKLQLTAMGGYSIARVRKQYIADAQSESEAMAKRNDVRMRAVRSGWQKQNEERGSEER